MFTDWFFHNKKRNEMIENIEEEVKEPEIKIQNPEDAEELYVRGVKNKPKESNDSDKLNEIHTDIIKRYAKKLTEGESSMSYPIHPLVDYGNHIRIPENLITKVIKETNKTLGNNFKVSHYTTDSPYINDAIDIERKRGAK